MTILGVRKKYKQRNKENFLLEFILPSQPVD